MKLDTNVCQGKPPSLEEGPMRYERINENSDSNSIKRSNSCNRYIQFMKVILYLELILFIGWLGCILLTSYYWDHRYDSNNGPYDSPEWTEDHYSQDLMMKSDSIPVEDIEWPPREDDTKAATEKSKSYPDKVIEGKNDFIKFETTTTRSVTETDDMDMYESMVLSRWLETLKHPGNNWDESSSKLDSFWSRMMNSAEEQNDKFDKSSREKVTLNEDSDTASMTQNYFGTIDNENYELSDIDILDLLTLQLWQDFSWTLNSTDEITDSDKDSIQDNRFVNFRFDFELPDLVERHLSRQTRMANEQDENSSSSSSEETNSPAPNVKHSTDSSSSSSSEETNSPAPKEKRSTESSSSSSSEETNGRAAIAKRSAESSSSEETKTPAPKVKRSTDSSSSESDSSSSSDDSSSIDSLSSVNDRITTKAIKGKTSCPKMIDDDGNTIDDPKDIVNHIRRNWFKWLLKTPFPDCDPPTSLKTVTINECGKFVIKCTLDESDETSEKSKESVSNHRVTRSVEETDLDRETCERLVDVTRIIFKGMKTDVVLEELCRPMVQEFGGYVIGAVIKVIFQLLTGQNTTESMDSQNLETNRRVQKIIDELRNLENSMATVYTNCSDISTESNEFGGALEATTMAKEQENTLISLTRMQEKVDSLAAEIVTGDSLDVTVIELREKFKSMIGSLATSLASPEPRDPAVISTAPINIADEQWITHMLELKRQIENATEEPAIRRRLEASGSPTQEQTDGLRRIVEYYLSERKTFCHRVILFEFIHPLSAGKKMRLPLDVDRRKRSASSKWEPKYVGAKPIVVKRSIEEDDVRFHEERKARLEGWTKEKSGDRMDPRAIKSLLDTIEAEVSAENPAEIPINKVPSDYTDILLVANYLVANSSSDLRREAYELLRDVVLELQKLDNNSTAWEGYDLMNLKEKFKDCLIHKPDTITSEFIFMVVIRAGEAVNLRYSELVNGKKCGDPYKPVYGSFTYIGEEPEKLGVRNWRHILDEIVKLYFKIHDPNAHSGLKCDPIDVESETGSPEIGESKSIVKRSIGYPIRRFDNSVNVDDKVFADRDDTGSLITVNLDVDAEPRNFDMSREIFFNKMETLSSHIDRLHEHYMRFNELNDDYVSREFPVE